MPKAATSAEIFAIALPMTGLAQLVLANPALDHRCRTLDPGGDNKAGVELEGRSPDCHC